MRAQTGFSYFWLLFLIALISLGLSIAVEVEVMAAQREKEKALLATGRQFRTAIERYTNTQAVPGRYEYPTSLEDLLLDDRLPGVHRHLRKIFIDPITGKNEWGLVRLNGRIVGVHSLSDNIPIKQGLFEADEARFEGKQKYSDWTFTYPPELSIGPISGNPTKVN
jgi:type II secretory pathway pseudopilin PulG